MAQSLPVHQEIKNYEFNVKIMENLLDKARIAGAMNRKELKMIRNMPAAIIVAATAYFAGCPNPDQIAVLRIIDLLAAIRNKNLFAHRPGQTIRDRLLTGKCYPGGKEEIVEFAFSLLELNSLNDHNYDQNKDKRKGKYNPIGENIISFFTNQNILLKRLQQYPKLLEKYQALFKTDITIINWWSP